MADGTQIEALWGFSRDELFERLGALDEAAFATPENKRQRGHNFFRNTLEKYRERICADKNVQKYIGSEDGALKAQTAAAIADLMGGHGAAIVAVLVVQSGLRDICAENWRNGI